jgi:predicted lipoprotein with Yx(FWY)xxD motif
LNRSADPHVSRVSTEEVAMKRWASVVAVVVLGLSGLTACGDDGAAPSGSAPSPAGAVALATATVGDYGEVIVDGNGRTVYVFDKDTSGTSNCSGDCLAKWPPVPAGDGTPKFEGIDASLISTITRPDGTKQLAVKGLPLYLFADDSKPGEAKGQAVGGVWWVVGTDGQKITTKPGDSGNGYGY